MDPLTFIFLANTVETSLLNEAVKGLVVSGPVAIILAVVVVVLWKENRRLNAKLDKANKTTLTLAVRVQRSVEVLAGIQNERTAVEDVLDDDDRERRKTPDDDHDE